MSSTNKSKPKQVSDVNNEGVKVIKLRPDQELERAILATFLFEDGFYEDGTTLVNRVAALIPKVKPEFVAELAIKARNEYHLRHIPLFIVCEMLKHNTHKGLVRHVLNHVIKRADELSEVLALYWKNGKTPIANQLKKGLAEAFTKFDEYALSKYNREKEIKLRDVLFLVHAKPLDKKQEKLWKKLVEDKLAIPDTWETELSASTNKKASWTRLLEDKVVGGLAFLRNLRNIQDAGVDRKLVQNYFSEVSFDKVLPFRFIAAAKHAPIFEAQIEQAMLRTLNTMSKLEGRTALVIDTSPSMWQAQISEKSELNRFDAAAALAIMAREICETVDIYAFNEKVYEVPARHGMALKEALEKTKGNASCGGLAVDLANKNGYDRIICLTDGEWHYSKVNSAGQYTFGSTDKAETVSPAPLTKQAYMINIANTRNGFGYGKWQSINGFSEAVLQYIQLSERS